MSKIIESRNFIACPDCPGNGIDADSGLTCKSCNGQGNLTAILHTTENETSIRLPRRIVARIINNLLGRRGIKWEIEACDDDVKIQMLYTLENIVRECMRGAQRIHK